MRHGKKFKKLGRPASHRRAMLRNMVTSLFAHRAIKTTMPKAKEARRSAERLIRYAISGTLADKRRIIAYLKDRKVAHEVIKMGQENFAKRPAGGYTAIYRIEPRKGDGAPMALLKLLTEPKEKKKKKRKRRIPEPEVIETVEALEKEAEMEEEMLKQSESEKTAESAGEEISQETQVEEAPEEAEETSEQEIEKPQEEETAESSAPDSVPEDETPVDEEEKNDAEKSGE